ncbi:MAG TPA: H(+)-transporting ATPase [Firmicutes bacterium]|nr:H(+)-transporting ATPase [Bacillota bacterium]
MFTKLKISPYLLVFISFVILIFIGTFLFMLPFAHRDMQWGNFVNSLFVSASAVCVTGLSPYTAVIDELTLFGQIILLILIAIGGLGFITVFTFFVTLSGRRIGIIDRFIIKEALSLSSMKGVINFVRKVIFITLIIEGIGIIPYAFVLIPRYGIAEGLFQSLFLSVSAFNNAGFDLLGSTSMQAYSSNVIVNVTTMLLIVSGGLGFLVWFDILSKRSIRNWSAYTKVVLTMTAILIPFGAIALLATEWSQTSGLTIMQALFHSISARTAGFSTIDMNTISLAGRLFLMILMFIGANPISTGGGVKTTTIFIIVLAIISFIRGKKVHAFKRSFSDSTVIKAMALTFIAGVLVFMSIIIIERLESGNPNYTPGQFDASAFMFEAFSAFGTVGLSQGVTPFLTDGSKIILAMLMLLGRTGPMTMFAIVSESMNKADKMHFKYIEATIPIG